MNSQLMLGQRFICWTEYEMTRKLLSWLGDRNYDSIFLGSAYIGNLLNFVLFHKSYGMVDFEGACWSATGNFFFLLEWRKATYMEMWVYIGNFILQISPLCKNTWQWKKLAMDLEVPYIFELVKGAGCMPVLEKVLSPLYANKMHHL